MRCGLHYVRFCDLRTKQCTAAPASQAAAKAIADALAGGPLARRKVHAFAKHLSGSRPGAPGARLPSDVVTLDPRAPKPPGPANPQAQAEHLGSQEGGPRASAPQQEMQAENPGHTDALGNLEPPGIDGQEESIPAHEAQNGSPRQPAGVPAGGDPGGDKPTRARHRQVTNPLGPGHDHASPGGSVHEGGRDGTPQNVRALLGLRPKGNAPNSPRGALPGVGKCRKPPKPEAKRSPGGLLARKPRRPKALPEPSGDPKGRIQRWLVPSASAVQASQGGAPGPPCEPSGQDPRYGRPQFSGGGGPQEDSWRIPGAPGSSTDPPPYAGQGGGQSPAQGGRDVGQVGPPAARRARPGRAMASQRAQALAAPFPEWERGTCPVAGASSEDEAVPPLLSAIPDLFVPFPGRGGPRVPPVPAGGVQGSWSLIRQPAACERGALPDSRDSQAWSLSLSLGVFHPDATMFHAIAV